MRSFKGIFIVSCFILFTGCSKADEVIIYSSTKDIQEFMHEQNKGFIIITNEINASFLEEVQAALIEKQQTTKLFNVFYNNGEQKNPFGFEMPSVNTIYYIKDGNFFEEYNLET